MGKDKTPILATDKDDVGKSAIDYFSWGHICMGIASFLLFSLINAVPSLVEGYVIDIIPWALMILLVLVFAIAWEIIENTLLVEWEIKFEGRKDSFFNSFWDIIFVVLGGVILWIIKGIMINLTGNIGLYLAFYIVGVIGFVICLIGFLIGRYVIH